LQFIDLKNRPEDVVLLERFYGQLFVPGFPDEDERESLETLQDNLVKREAGFFGDNNYHILLLVDGDHIVAGSIFDYMAQSNCGAIEYILAAEAYRGRGFGWQIHERSVALMREDARRAGKADINAVMLEVNDPFRVSAAMDVVDPFDRVLMWQRWGYQRLRFPYEQPALSAEQSAIDYLLLGVKVINPDLARGFPPQFAKAMVVDYLVWANRLTELEDDPFYGAMSAYARTITIAPLEDFDAYIGHRGDLTVTPVLTPEGEAWQRFKTCFQRHFPAGPTTVPDTVIADRLKSASSLFGSRYHAWLLAGGRGLTTFFSLPQAGFLGYIALDKELRGQGLSRVAIKRIEAQLIRDRPDTTHCYLETEPGSPQEAAFLALGFRSLPIVYFAPPVADGSDPYGDGQRMSLLRKRLGDEIIVPPADSEELLRHLETMLHVVFGLAEPRKSACYRTALDSLS